MKPIYQKGLIISHQKLELSTKVPLLFSAYNNLSNNELKLYEKAQVAFFNSTFLGIKGFFPLVRGSFFAYPLKSRVEFAKFYPICIVVGNYVIPYKSFNARFELVLRLRSLGLHSLLLKNVVSPIFFGFANFYRIFFLTLFKYAYYKSTVEKMSKA